MSHTESHYSIIMRLANDSDLQFCNENLLVNFSAFCLSQQENFPDQCFPSEYKELRMAVGVWAIICGIVGFIGNLLTIMAIPYAAKKNQ